MNNTAKENINKSNNLGSIGKGAINTMGILGSLKNTNATGGQRLADIISYIMSWGGKGATDATKSQ